MENVYADIDLVRLAEQTGGVHLDGQLVLIDSLIEKSRLDEVGEIFKDYPMKPSFTVAIFCTSGQIRFNVNLHSYEVSAREILMIHEGDIVEFKGASADSEASAAAFKTGFFFRIDTHIDATMQLRRMLTEHPLFRPSDGVIDELTVLYNLMKAKIVETENPFRHAIVVAFSKVMAYCAYHNMLDDSTFGAVERKSPGRHEQLCNRFMDEVKKNFTRERGVAFYAERLSVTPKYLSQVVRKVSGRFASDWINDYVILEAKAMLKSHRYTAQEVAYTLNFASQSSFGKFFKKNVGIAPMEYAKG